MKSTIISIIFLLKVTFTIGQTTDDFQIVVADSTWTREIITFPIEWAPKVTLKGFQELRFAPKRSNPKSDEFWTLVMSWKIQSDSLLSLDSIKVNLKSYFDGLMKPNHWAETFPEPKISQVSNNQLTMTFFDGFYTGKIIFINILVYRLWCKKTKRSIVVLKLSPKAFTHHIWQRLETIQIKTKYM